MPNDEICALKDRFVEQLAPLKVYLFGSYAYGTPSADSDYDFYIVVDDHRTNTYEEAVHAYRAIRHARTKPVDILVGTNEAFERKRRDKGWTVESEVFNKGVLLYDATSSVSAMA